MSTKALILSLTTLISLNVFAGPPVYSSLKASRSKISIPHYTQEQKQLVLNQARIVLEQIYVHQEIKTRDFGTSANPTPYLDKIQLKIQTISDLDFHKRLSEIFYRLRDLHTLYFLPKPFSCYETFLPFRLVEVLNTNGEKVIAVSEVGDDETVLSLLPKPFKLKIGDVLTKYDGLSVEAAIKSKSSKSAGANASADRRKSIERLKFNQHDLDFLPEKDSIKLEFMNAEGNSYKTELPWITLTDWNCLAESKITDQEIPVGLRLLPLTKLKTKKKILVKPSKTRGEVLPPGHTNEPVLYWHINKSIHGTFGYLQLVSFTPDVMSVDEVVTTIKHLLRYELKDTDGLMFDLRSNTGGQLPLAERLVQFFSPKEVQPNNFMLKNSPANMYYMNTTAPKDPFTEALNLANSMGEAYSSLVPIDTFEQVNDMGQVYFKPVAVFVNSSCYSACETLSSQFQDHQIGTIFGEDATTGGGGANTYSLNELMQDFRGADTGMFKQLPAGQNMTFAFREAFRGGVYKDTHIENRGVKADRLSPMAMTDLFNATNDQLLVLQKYLKEESPKFTSNIFLANEERLDFVISKKAQFQASWNDTTALEFRIDGEPVATRAIPKMGKDTLISIPAAAILTKKVSEGRIEMLGSKNSKRAWRKILNYRIIPENKNLAMNEAWTVNLKKEGDVSLYTHNTKASDAWNISEDSLYLGNGSSYADLSHAEASIFVSLNAKASEMSFDASIKTESTDPLQLILVSEGKTVVLIEKLSGDLPMTNYKVDLSAFQEKSVELRFVFESDPEVTDKGITIKNIVLK